MKCVAAALLAALCLTTAAAAAPGGRLCVSHDLGGTHIIVCPNEVNIHDGAHSLGFVCSTIGRECPPMPGSPVTQVMKRSIECLMSCPGEFGTCAWVLSGQSTRIPADQCSCLGNCAQSHTCCRDIDSFNANFRQYVTANVTAPDALHKTEPTVVLYRTYSYVRSLVAYRQCSFTRASEQTPWEQQSCGDDYEVVSYSYGEDAFHTFEQSVDMRDPVPVSFGYDSAHHAAGDARYYALLTGGSAVAALKSALTGLKHCFLAADLAETPTGKLAFDRTANRTWSLLNATYTLDSAAHKSGPADVTPQQLDTNYQRYARKSHYKVSPSQACFLREVQIDGVWQSMLADDGKTWQAIPCIQRGPMHNACFEP
ncbi:hypothetical protein RI367_005002 [Sorochytrium milnesiophthora]